MDQILSALLGMLVMGLLAGSLLLWWQALKRLTSGNPLLNAESRKPVPWGMVDLVVIFIITFGALVAGQSLAYRLFDIPLLGNEEELDPHHLSVAIFSSSLSLLAACLVSVILLIIRGASWRDLGLQVGTLFSDIKLGGAAFVMLAPPMYFLQFLLTRLWPSEHPLQTLLREDPQVDVVLWAALTAAVVSPLTEEIFFRLIFQGWMEKWSTLTVKLQRGSYEMSPAGAAQSQRDVTAVFLGDQVGRMVAGGGEPFEPIKETPIQATIAEEAAVSSAKPQAAIDSENPYATNPYAPPAFESHIQDVQPAKSPTESDDAAHPPPRRWPIVVSAAIFALMHWGHGPDPVPLFFLALGLGYLYQRTHRLLPCMMVHFLVNSLSMVALIAFLLSGQEPP